MIELPESHTLSAQLASTVKGKTIEHTIAGLHKHGFAFYYGEPEAYDAKLKGKTITAAYPLAGYIVIEAEDMRLTFHDGVNMRYYSAGAKEPPKHQLLLRFTDQSFIVCTVQMYGGMMAFLDGEMHNPYFDAAKNSVSPLTDAFDLRHFEGIISACQKKTSAKALLATNQRIPGLGNGCLQDILFFAGINPQSHIGALTDLALETLFHSVKDTLARMTAEGGRNTEKDLFGTLGSYQTILSNLTRGQPCIKCGGEITRKAYMGGNVYFCPSCQPQKKI